MDDSKLFQDANISLKSEHSPGTGKAWREIKRVVDLGRSQTGRSKRQHLKQPAPALKIGEL